MKLTAYDDAVAFREQVLPFLMRHEAENNLMISIVIRLADGTGRWGDDPARLWLVEDGAEIAAVAVQTPPYHLQLTQAPPEVIAAITRHCREQRISLSGVLGPAEAVASFIEQWSVSTGCTASLEKNLRIYQLDQVTPVTVSGGWAEAGEEDLEALVEMMHGYTTDTHAAEVEAAREHVRHRLEMQQFQLWKDPQPVSVAAFCGPTPHGMRINGVYTPPEFRRKGYATANVAVLSQRLLDSGCQFCYLFTDLANPISNSIYQKIGYRPVCDFNSYAFSGGQP